MVATVDVLASVEVTAGDVVVVERNGSRFLVLEVGALPPRPGGYSMDVVARPARSGPDTSVWPSAGELPAPVTPDGTPEPAAGGSTTPGTRVERLGSDTIVGPGKPSKAR